MQYVYATRNALLGVSPVSVAQMIVCATLGNANQRESLRYIYCYLSHKIAKTVDEKITNGAEKCIFEILWCVTYLYAE